MKKSRNKGKILCFGEVLWDELPDGRRIGGAPLNVAYHLRKLGAAGCLVSRVGKDESGRAIKGFVKENGLSDSLIQTDGNHPTSKVLAKVGKHHEVTYDIVENVAWDYIEYNPELITLTEQAAYLVYGSLITRHDVSKGTLYRLLDIPWIKVLDVNLRPPFYSQEVLKKLLAGADIVKMNASELKVISALFISSDNDKEQMAALCKIFRWKVLMVTCGAEGAYVCDDSRVIFEPGSPVTVANTIGSGDAFLAGFLSVYARQASLQQSLKVANAMGAFVAQQPGGCPFYEAEDIQSIIDQ